jgi:mannose-6-phosphate isomerase-like protein (cupin superfamily)
MEQRPWGFYEVLSDAIDHKVKRITVHPGKRLSLQRHKHRSEHWFIVEGMAHIQIGNEEFTAVSGDSVDISTEELHRIEAVDRVVFIEVQTGGYFGEDDIERLEDDYGR